MSRQLATISPSQFDALSAIIGFTKLSLAPRSGLHALFHVRTTSCLVRHCRQQSRSPFCSLVKQTDTKKAFRPSSSTVDKAELSEEKRRVVETKHKCVRVVAGPGSGKTRVLTYRVAHLISNCGVPPENVMFVTFTNKAAQELRDRLGRLFGSEVTRKLTVGTFHGIGAKILRSHPCFGIDENFVIYDSSDSERVLKNIVKTFQKILEHDSHPLHESKAENSRKLYGHLIDLEKLGFLDSGTAEYKLLKNLISIPKNEKDVQKKALKKLFESIKAAKLYKITSFIAEQRMFPTPRLSTRLSKVDLSMAMLYEKTLRRNNAVDFDDLIHLLVQLLHSDGSFRQACQERWKYVLVDEFQDTDLVQYEFIRLLASKNQNLFVVGDIDQAIFGWRGAEFRHMQRALEVDFPSIATFQLRENYRSSSPIVKAASVILKFCPYDRTIGNLQPLSLIPVKGLKDLPIGVAELESPMLEASFVASEIQKLVWEGECSYGSFAILYRTRAQSNPLEKSLLDAQIPYRIFGSTPFYSRKEVKILLAYLQLTSNLENEVSLEYCLNVPPRGIGEKSIDILRTWASVHNVSFPKALERIHAENLSHKDLGLRPKTRNAITDFVSLINHLQEVSSHSTVSDLLRALIQKISYIDYIKDVSKDDKDFKQNIERIQQLLVCADINASVHGIGRKALSCYLEEVALLTNHEESQDNDLVSENAVTLSTLHSSKGLEYDCVFLVGANDSLIPLEGSDLGEERRLFYVGVTRARKRLYLTHSCQPFTWQQTTAEMSRFVKELLRALPKHYIQYYSRIGGSPAMAKHRRQQENRHVADHYL